MEGDSQVPILRVVLRTIDGDELPSDVNLAERIGNENGVFVYGKFRRMLCKWQRITYGTLQNDRCIV